MCPISGTTRSISNGATSWDIGSSTDTASGKNYYQDVIEQANSVPLTFIFKLYGLFLDPNIRKAICPFKSHKAGHESSPSFCYYPETNSFYCYGCKVGGKWAHGCEFVSILDEISRMEAAKKILDLFSQDIDLDNVYDEQNFSERLEIMLNFSDAVHSFRKNNINQDALTFLEEYVCKSYDKINTEHKLDNSALKRTVEELKMIMELYE